ncbi:hypothetical protein B0H11DRAFT_1909660 [Mycena galericulata]|nr:hypothetical protein B0H11DRAFT_1909660 [Mycena galericulata]
MTTPDVLQVVREEVGCAVDLSGIHGVGGGRRGERRAGSSPSAAATFFILQAGIVSAQGNEGADIMLGDDLKHCYITTSGPKSNAEAGTERREVEEGGRSNTTLLRPLRNLSRFAAGETSGVLSSLLCCGIKARGRYSVRWTRGEDRGIRGTKGRAARARMDMGATTRRYFAWRAMAPQAGDGWKYGRAPPLHIGAGGRNTIVELTTRCSGRRASPVRSSLRNGRCATRPFVEVPRAFGERKGYTVAAGDGEGRGPSRGKTTEKSHQGPEPPQIIPLVRTGVYPQQEDADGRDEEKRRREARSRRCCWSNGLWPSYCTMGAVFMSAGVLSKQYFRHGHDLCRIAAARLSGVAAVRVDHGPADKGNGRSA